VWTITVLNRYNIDRVKEILQLVKEYNIKATFTNGRSISTRHTGSSPTLRYRDGMQDIMPSIQLFLKDAKIRLLQIFGTMESSGRTLYAVNPETMEAIRADFTRSDAAVWGIFTMHKYLAENQ